MTSTPKLRPHSAVAIRGGKHSRVNRDGVDGLGLCGGGERRRGATVVLRECIVVEEYECESGCRDFDCADIVGLVALHCSDVLRSH